MSVKTPIQDAVAGRSTVTSDRPQTIQQYIKRMEGEIVRALPSVITSERFTRIVLTALSTNPKLAECTPQSFLGAMMTAAQLGVEPNTPLGQAYLIPYFNKKRGVMECQFQLGYVGLIDLAHRSGEVNVIQAQVVYEQDYFEYAYGLDSTLNHIPAKSDRGVPVFVYALFKAKNGGYGFEVMSIDDIRTHANKYSQAVSSGPWVTNFEEMAKKTVLKRVLKFAPLKSDTARAISSDETIKHDIGDDMGDVQSTYIEGDASEAKEEAVS